MTAAMKPVPISDAELAFPASVSRLMPAYEDIPREFHMLSTNKFVRFFEDCFYRGVKVTSVTPKEGVDGTAAMRHVRAIMRSFEPKHEHKTAACAYLLSLWFDDIQWEVSK